jgi:hypothetical protein
LFIVTLLHETFYWQEMENPKSLYFDWFSVFLFLIFTSNLSHLFSEFFLRFLFASTHSLSHVYTHSHFVVYCVEHTHLGFWNVTNSWENRSRKGNNTTQHISHIFSTQHT